MPVPGPNAAEPAGSSPEVGSLLVVTGPPAAGKTTVAPLVAERRGDRAVCIEADWLWTTIRRGFIEPWEPESDHQNRTVLRSVASAAAEMAGGGYQVVIEGVIGPWHLPVLSDVAAAGGIELHYVVLRPSLAACLARARRRASEPPRVPGHPPLAASGPIRQLWEQLSDLGPFEDHVIDTTALTPPDTVVQVLQRLDAGRLRVPAATNPA